MRFMFLLPGSSLVIRHFSESPRLSLTLSSHPGMNDLSDEELVMTMTDLDFSLVLSRVCQISFGNLSHSDQHQLSHETQIFMSDE